MSLTANAGAITGNTRDERRLASCRLTPAKMMITEKTVAVNKLLSRPARSKTE
jgi:hypothetical protein